MYMALSSSSLKPRQNYGLLKFTYIYICNISIKCYYLFNENKFRISLLDFSMIPPVELSKSIPESFFVFLHIHVFTIVTFVIESGFTKYFFMTLFIVLHIPRFFQVKHAL